MKNLKKVMNLSGELWDAYLENRPILKNKETDLKDFSDAIHVIQRIVSTNQMLLEHPEFFDGKPTPPIISRR